MTNTQYTYGSWQLDTAALLAKKADHSVALTPTEAALLVILIENAGQTVTRQTLLHEIWGFDAPVQTRTIDACIVRLRRKLSLGHSLLTVYGQGYRLLAASAS